MALIKPTSQAFIILITIALCNALACTNGYTQYGQGQWCYKVMNAVNGFDIASKNCKADGGDLASIHDANENTFVAGLGNGVNLLVGFQYAAASKSYHWSDNTQNDYSNWEAGYPKQQEYFGECTTVQQSGTWNNAECFSVPLQYVCKKPVTADAACPAVSEFHDNGEITSPGYPSTYQSGLACTYELMAKNGHSITLEFMQLKMGFTDSIQIYRGLVATPPNLLANLQGHQPDPPMKYETPDGENKMLVKFTSAAQTTGFWKLKFSTNDFNRCPDKSDYAESGQISSYGYPVGYGDKLNCTYHLSVSSGVIKLIFGQIDIHAYSDTLAIYDGPIPSGTPTYAMSHSAPGFTVVSTSRYMTVVFISQGNRHDGLTGWSATFNRTCSGSGWIPGSEWHPFCYKVTDYTRTFTGALRTCQSEGGQLVSIPDAFENTFVANLTSYSQQYWLGFVYYGGNWLWEDGTNTKFTSWDNGEPGDLNYASRYCAVIVNSGRWKRVDCNSGQYFAICYKP